MKDNTKQVRRGGAPDNRAAGVGYRNPPKQHRFKKGKSGNPQGRSRGQQNLLGIFKEIVLEKIKVRIAGKVRVMTRGEAVFRANFAALLKKNPKAMHNLFMMSEEGQQFVDYDDPKQVGRPIAFGTPMTMEEFEAAFGTPTSGDPAAKSSDPKKPKP
jgi:hypothetical protein